VRHLHDYTVTARTSDPFSPTGWAGVLECACGASVQRNLSAKEAAS
jgi:hypothetical protein